MFQVFFCEIKDIHRPADIYGGNGASWEAVPSIEKPLVRVREEDDIKPIHELFFFSPKLLLSNICIFDLNSTTRSTQLRPTGWWRDLKNLRLLRFSKSNPSSWDGDCAGGKNANNAIKEIEHQGPVHVKIINNNNSFCSSDPIYPFSSPSNLQSSTRRTRCDERSFFFNAIAPWNFLNQKSNHFVLAFFSKGWASFQPARPCEHAWHCLE